MKFNTAIATLMALTNDFYANGCTVGDLKALVLMLSPFASHLCEEMWENLGGEGMVCHQKWPAYDESKTVAAQVEVAVQVAGKLRASIMVPTDMDDAGVVALALEDYKIKKQAEGKTLVKQIVVRGKDGNIKLVNLIFKPVKA